ncbi:hypothetical protein [Fortiea contorta]|uniref:hypothetical protein n=1 Tax=Fortiea contorta TaxID=1892405 RepID=UPI0003494CDB|nr:hypothetical protein [Fortiea contorta]
MAKTESVDLFIAMTDSSAGGAGNGAVKIKFAWKGNKVAYPDDIAKQIGVQTAKANEPGLIYGMNKPRPARIYVNVSMGQGKSRAFLLFADPGKLGTLLIKNSLRGKKYRGGTITSVSLPKTSTNPTRSKTSSTAGKPGSKPGARPTAKPGARPTAKPGARPKPRKPTK